MTGKLSGQQIKVGGSGMKGFYGSPTENKLGIVGKVAKALVKELTGKEGEWKTKRGRSQDHLFDCEVMQLVMAYLHRVYRNDFLGRTP